MNSRRYVVAALAALPFAGRVAKATGNGPVYCLTDGYCQRFKLGAQCAVNPAYPHAPVCHYCACKKGDRACPKTIEKGNPGRPVICKRRGRKGKPAAILFWSTAGN